MLFWFLIIAGIIAAAGACCCVTCPTSCSDFCDTGTTQATELTITFTGVAAPIEDGAACTNCERECDCSDFNATFVVPFQVGGSSTNGCKRYATASVHFCPGQAFGWEDGFEIDLLSRCPDTNEAYFYLEIDIRYGGVSCARVVFEGAIGSFPLDCDTYNSATVSMSYVGVAKDPVGGPTYNCPYVCDFTNATITIEV